MLFREEGKDEISVLGLDGMLECVMEVFKLLSDI